MGSTGISIHVFVAAAPVLPTKVPAAGALFQVVPVSVQVSVVVYALLTLAVAVVTYRRSFAEVTAEIPSPVTLNFR